jgi:hypothetical protein
MTQQPDIERLLDHWFAEGPSQVPDRVFDDAVGRLDRQSQTSAWRLRWRNLNVTTPARLAVAAIAIIAVLGAGLVVLRPSSNVGQPPIPTASPSPSPSPSSASTVDGAQRLPISGPIEPGRYYIERGPLSAATFSFTVPAGWSAQNGGLVKHRDDSEREIGWGPTVVETLFADPCGTNETVAIGPTADDLIAALAELPGLEVGDPADITIGGQPARSVELTVAPTMDVATCDPPIGLQVWLDRAGSYLLIGPDLPGRIVAMDVAGGRLVLVYGGRESTPPGDVAELDEMLATIQVEP